jgi:hypothetical protein
MSIGIETHRRDAQRRFLGRWPVISIGIGGEGGQELVFLLEQHSATMQAEILEWAECINVVVQIDVSGPITLLKRM